MPVRKLQYQSGFLNEFATEAVAGALPRGQNSPQRHPLGLYTEQFSGTPFTAPRGNNRRTWPGRQPSVADLLAHCRENLASYKVPASIALVAALPKTPVGKIDKKALREEGGSCEIL